MFGCSVLLPVSVIFLVFLLFLLQLAALTTTWWAYYVSRTDLGKPKETGHYGLWTLCSLKGPHWIEDCDELDTFFQMPAYTGLAGILGIIHILLLLVLLPLGTMRAAQVIRNVPDWGIRPKVLCILKVSVSFLSVIFAILVAIFASVGENKNTEYTVNKSSSFWLQISVIVTDIVITLVCAAENIRYWQEHIQDTSDPMGERAETYGNPTFDPGSPESTRRDRTNGSISYTDASGEPYARREAEISRDNNGKRRREPSHPHGRKSGALSNSTITDVHTNKENATIITIDTLSYENPSFQEQSPQSRRARRHR